MNSAPRGGGRRLGGDRDRDREGRQRSSCDANRGGLPTGNKKEEKKERTEMTEASMKKLMQEDPKEMESDIKDLIRGERMNGRRTWHEVIILNFNLYCPTPEKYRRGEWIYLPGEVGLTALNMRSGKIVESVSSLIDPGSIPLGYASAVKEGMKENGLRRPGFDPKYQDFNSIVRMIDAFISKHSAEGCDVGEWAPLFCFRDEMPSFYNAMKWLYGQQKQSGREKIRSLHSEFRLRPLEVLLKTVSELGINVGTAKPQKFLVEEHAKSFLNSSNLRYAIDLACAYHKNPHNPDVGLELCSKLVTQRLAHSLIDSGYRF